MRALNIFVWVMAVVIIVGFGVVAAVIAGRLSHREAAGAARPFAAPAIPIPAGARVEAMAVSADRLVLDLSLPSGGRDILILDLATGTRLGTIELRQSH
jgi:hypothetical protein